SSNSRPRSRRPTAHAVREASWPDRNPPPPSHRVVPMFSLRAVPALPEHWFGRMPRRITGERLQRSAEIFEPCHLHPRVWTDDPWSVDTNNGQQGPFVNVGTQFFR